MKQRSITVDFHPHGNASGHSLVVVEVESASMNGMQVAMNCVRAKFPNAVTNGKWELADPYGKDISWSSAFLNVWADSEAMDDPEKVVAALVNTSEEPPEVGAKLFHGFYEVGY